MDLIFKFKIMFAPIPDKIYKLFILIGVALFVYFVSQKNLIRNEIKIIEKEIIINNSEKNIPELYKLKNKLLIELDSNNNIIFYGFGFLTIGVFIWLLDEIQEENRRLLVKVEDRLYRFCQSCGMKFTSVRKYGTNKDKSNSNAFCEDCYKKGKFTNPELTVEQVIQNSKLHFKGNYFKKYLLKDRLRKLERFNINKYQD